MASKAGMPVLKRRLQEKLQTLRQCEDDLSTSASARRGQRDLFMRQKTTILSQVCAEFDRLSAAIDKKRKEVAAAVESEMEDLYQKSMRDSRDTEDLQGKVNKCLQDAQGLLSCADRSAFLSTYSAINQHVEDVLLEVLMALETEETTTDPQLTEQTSFQLLFSLSAVAQLLLATKASVSVVGRTQETSSSPRHSLRNCASDSAVVGDGLGATAAPQTTTGQDKYEDRSAISSSTNLPCSSYSPQASQPRGSRGAEMSSSAKTPSTTLPTQQPNMGNKMAVPQLKPLQLKVHSTLQVLVTEVRSVEEFWVQPLTQDLEKLTYEMREYFSLHRTCRKDQYSTPTSTPARGSYCCAQFTADDEWYRAKVLDIGRPTPHSAPLMKVFYVDYGNQELQPLNRLRSLPAHLCSLPMQAISCSLADTDSACMTKKAVSWFQEYFPGQVATIEVVELATQFCYLVRCQVVPAHLEGLDVTTTKQLRSRNLVDVLHVMECMSGHAQEGGGRAPSQEGSASPSAHHSAKSKAPGSVMMHSGGTSCKGEGRCTHPMAALSDDARTVASPTVEETSGQEQHVASATAPALPDRPSRSPSSEQSPTNRQQCGTETLLLTDDCINPDKEVDIREEKSVRNGGLLEESSVDLNTSGIEISVDLPPNVPSQDENDVGRTGSCGSLPSASVEDANMDTLFSSSDYMKDATFLTPPTLSDLNTREIPIEDNSFALIVSNIISPSLFYAHVVSPDSSDLDLLQQQINQYYGAPDSSLLLGCPPLPSMNEEGAASATKDQQRGPVPLFEVGSLCAAKLPEDDCWYRGVVIGVREGGREGARELEGEGEGTKEEVEEKGERKGARELEGEGEGAKEEAQGARELDGEGEGTKEEVEEKGEREGARKLEGEGEGAKEEIQGTRELDGEGEGAKEEAQGARELDGEGEGTKEEVTEEKEEREGARKLEGESEGTKEEGATEEKEERVEVSSNVKCRGTQYHIHYLDYGDAVWVSAEQVCPLHRQFLNTPVQTVRLSLVGVAPAITSPTPLEREAPGFSPSSVVAPKSAQLLSSKAAKAELQPLKKVKKKHRKRSRSKLSCNILPAGGEPEEDDHHGHFKLRSPSDSQLKDLTKTSLQAGAHYSSAPDVYQRLQGSCSNVLEASNSLDHLLCSEEKRGVTWSKEAITTFKDLSGEQVLLAMVLEEDLSVCSSPGSQTIKLSSVMDVLPVMLYDTTTDVDVFINAVLVERGLARIDGAALSSDVDSTQPLSPTTMGLDDWDPLRKHFLAQSNDYERSLAAESEKRVELCRHFNSRRGCSRGNRCIYLHVPRGPFSDVKTLESAAPNLRLYQPLPPRHTWVAVEVITVVTPYSFYVHFPIGTTPLLEQQTAMTSVVGGRKDDSLWTFEQLREDMNARYSMGLHQWRQGSLLAEGELVAACYSGDDNWYRALVLKTNSARDDVAVFYVDFGNSEDVPESRVRSLSQEFTHLPFQAVECRLADVSAVTEAADAASVEDAWREGMTALTDLVKDRVLVAKIIRPFPVAGMEVELYDTSDVHCDTLINKKMVELGHLMPSSSAGAHSSSECRRSSSLDPPRKSSYARELVMLPG